MRMGGGYLPTSNSKVSDIFSLTATKFETFQQILCLSNKRKNINPYNDLNYYFKQLQRRLSKLLYSGLFLYGGNVCIVLQSIIQKLKNEIILLQYVQRNYPELVHIFN